MIYLTLFNNVTAELDSALNLIFDSVTEQEESENDSNLFGFEDSESLADYLAEAE